MSKQRAATKNLEGSRHCSAGRYHEAAQCFREAVRLDPRSAVHQSDLGFALERKGDFDEAEACYRQAIRLDPQHAPTHNDLANLLQDHRGKLDEAEQHLREAVRLDPRSAASQCNLGVALERKGDFDEAEACYRQAIRLDPQFALAQSNLAKFLLFHRGKLDEAEQHFREAVRLDPLSAVHQSNLGAVLRLRGEFDEAELFLRQAIKLDPSFSYAHGNLGLVLHQRGGNPAEAEAELREGLRLNPKLPDVRIGLGELLDRQGAPLEGVKECYRQAIRWSDVPPQENPSIPPQELRSFCVSAHIHLGTLLETRRSDFEGALKCFARALSIDGDNSEARQGVNRVTSLLPQNRSLWSKVFNKPANSGTPPQAGTSAAEHTSPPSDDTRGPAAVSSGVQMSFGRSKELGRHLGGVSCVVATQEHVFSGGNDNRLVARRYGGSQAWEIEAPGAVPTLPPSPQPVPSSPPPELQSDGLAVHFPLDQQTLQHAWVSPDWLCYIVSGNVLVVRRCDGSLERRERFSSDVRCGALLPDGRGLTIGSGACLSVFELTPSPNTSPFSRVHVDTGPHVICVACGDCLYTASDSGRLFSISYERQLIAQAEVPVVSPVVALCALAIGGVVGLTQGGDVLLWDGLFRRVEVICSVAPSFAARMSIDVSPNQSFVAVPSGSAVSIVSLGRRRAVCRLGGPGHAARAAAFSSSGWLVVGAFEGGHIWVWTIGQSVQLVKRLSLESVFCAMCFSSDLTLEVASANADSVCLSTSHSPSLPHRQFFVNHPCRDMVRFDDLASVEPAGLVWRGGAQTFDQDCSALRDRIKDTRSWVCRKLIRMNARNDKRIAAQKRAAQLIATDVDSTDPHGATQRLKCALETYPNDSDSWRHLGMLLHDLDQHGFSDFLRAFQKSLIAAFIERSVVADIWEMLESWRDVDSVSDFLDLRAALSSDSQTEVAETANGSDGTESTLSMVCNVEHQMVPLGLSDSTTVAVSLLNSNKSPARCPMDVFVVLFTSPSHCLDLAKLATIRLLDSLQGSDRIGLITYDDEVRTVCELEPKSVCEHRLREVVAGLEWRPGESYLSGGLYEAIRKLRQGSNMNPSSNILLLTDGVATKGIHPGLPEFTEDTEDSGEIQARFIRNLALGMYAQDLESAKDFWQEFVETDSEFHFAVHTFLFRPWHDPVSARIRILSDLTDGTFARINTVGSVSRAIAELMRSRSSVVAHDIAVRVELLNGVSFVPPNIPFGGRVSQNLPFIEFHLSPLRAIRPRTQTLLLCLPPEESLPPLETTADGVTILPAARVSCTYTETSSGALCYVPPQEITLSLVPPADPRLSDPRPAVNPAIECQILRQRIFHSLLDRFEPSKAMESALELMLISILSDARLDHVPFLRRFLDVIHQSSGSNMQIVCDFLYSFLRGFESIQASLIGPEVALPVEIFEFMDACDDFSSCGFCSALRREDRRLRGVAAMRGSERRVMKCQTSWKVDNIMDYCFSLAIGLPFDSGSLVFGENVKYLISLLFAVIELDPQQWQARALLGSLLFARGDDLRDFRTELEGSVGAHDDDTVGAPLLSVLGCLSEDLDESISYFKRAKRVKSTWPVVCFNLALRLKEKEGPKSVSPLSVLNDARHRDSDQSDPCYSIAALLPAGRGLLDTSAVEAECYYEMGYLSLHAKGDLDAARHLFGQVLNMNPEHSKTLSEMENLDLELTDFQFSDVNLNHKLGGGTFCDVFVGLYGRRKVAVKRFNHVDREKTLPEVMSEVSLMKAFESHSNIVNVFGFGRNFNPSMHTEDLYAVMELGDMTLAQYISSLRGVPSLAVAMPLLLDMARAVKKLHGVNPPVIHRDIKPQNFLMFFSDDPVPTARLSDFGEARVMEKATAHTGAGTPCYAAPEIQPYLKNPPTKPGRPTYRISADIYSLGLTMLCLLVGSVNAQPSETVDVNLSLRSVIVAMLSEDPVRRPTAASVLEDFQTLYSSFKDQGLI